MMLQQDKQMKEMNVEYLKIALHQLILKVKQIIQK